MKFQFFTRFAYCAWAWTTNAFLLGLAAAFLLAGCQKSQPPPVPLSFLEEVTFRDATYGHGELEPYIYPGRPRIPDSLLTSDEEKLVREMIKNKWKYNISYNADNAVAVVDLSETGFVEWLNVNKFKEPPDNNFKRLSLRILAFQYKGGKWWYVASTVPEGWEGFDSERELAKGLYSVSDNSE